MRRMRIIEKGANSPTREEAATTPDLRYSFQSTGRFSIMSAISCVDRALSTELPVSRMKSCRYSSCISSSNMFTCFALKPYWGIMSSEDWEVTLLGRMVSVVVMVSSFAVFVL